MSRKELYKICPSVSVCSHKVWNMFLFYRHWDDLQAPARQWGGGAGFITNGPPTPTHSTLAGVTQAEGTLSKTDSSSTAMSRFFTRFRHIRPDSKDSHRPDIWAEAFNRIKFRSRCILSTRDRWIDGSGNVADQGIVSADDPTSRVGHTTAAADKSLPC